MYLQEDKRSEVGQAMPEWSLDERGYGYVEPEREESSLRAGSKRSASDSRTGSPVPQRDPVPQEWSLHENFIA